MEGELTRLRDLLPPDVRLIVGGHAMPAYREALEKIAAIQAKDLTDLCLILDELRPPARLTRRAVGLPRP